MNAKVLLPLAALPMGLWPSPAGVPERPAADESVFVKLDLGAHEKILYVWTRDADGQHSDFLAVVALDPKSKTYGKIIATAPTGSAANEAHHFGYTANADRILRREVPRVAHPRGAVGDEDRRELPARLPELRDRARRSARHAVQVVEAFRGTRRAPSVG